jgi:hypothetical protein
MIEASIVRGVGDINNVENEGNEDDIEITPNADVMTLLEHQMTIPSSFLNPLLEHMVSDFAISYLTWQEILTPGVLEEVFQCYHI